MSGQLQIRVSRPVLDFLQHSEAVQTLLHVLFPPRPVEVPAETEIDWEDGEPHRERDAEVAAH